MEIVEPGLYEDFAETTIKVIGVGGAGGNAVGRMVSGENAPVNGVDFYYLNTDIQALRKSKVYNTVQIGAELTGGRGCGGNPNVGRSAAEEDREAITNLLAHSHMNFIAAGMGGGTGTGAAPVIAEISKSLDDALTVAIVTRPFSFEGKRRLHFAEQGIQELSKHVDSLIIIPNDKLLKVLPKNTTFMDALAKADDVLRNAVLGITDAITTYGHINVDFEDVKTVMSGMGRAMLGIGFGEGEPGEGRAEKAAQEAVASPLLEDVDLSGARGILVAITSGYDMSMMETNEIMSYISSFANEDASIIFGSAFDPEMEGKIRVTLVATGIGQQESVVPKVVGTPVVEQTKPAVQQQQPVAETEAAPNVATQPTQAPVNAPVPPVAPPIVGTPPVFNPFGARTSAPSQGQTASQHDFDKPAYLRNHS